MPISVGTGATDGIGLWIARGLAQAGHHVVLVGRDRARATLSHSGPPTPFHRQVQSLF